MYYKRLKELRNDHDLSQEQVAKILKMKQPQYSRYELGKRDLSGDLIQRICLMYQVSADYLLELPKGLDWPR